MKSSKLFNLFAVGLLMGGAQMGVWEVGAIAAHQESATAQTSAPTSTSETQMVLQSGDFIATGEPTSGTAKIVKENGRYYLDLGDTFETKKGPKLVVILTNFFEPPKSRLTAGTYLELGKLQKIKGAQRYEIPENVDPTSYHSAVIWCKPFNVTFGSATLKLIQPTKP
jgi:Electron transfer DM13